MAMGTLTDAEKAAQTPADTSAHPEMSVEIDSEAAKKPFNYMIDTIHGHVQNIPAEATHIGGYVTGTADIKWTEEDWARFPKAARAEINQDVSPDPEVGNTTDSEPGAATIAMAVGVAKTREGKGLPNNIYIDASQLQALVTALNDAGVKQCHLWVADWNLDTVEATAMLGAKFGGHIVKAVQFASPSSNPNMVVPGGSMTLAEANVDVSVCQPDWLDFTRPTDPKPEPKTEGVVVMADLKTIKVASTDGGKTWEEAA